MKKEFAIIEALLFINGSFGLSQKKISDFLHLSEKETIFLLEEYQKKLAEDKSSGLELTHFNSAYKLVTKPFLFENIKSKVEYKEIDLSKPLLEVLTIIAYRQPITRPEIEKIRGVNSDYLIKKLLLFNYISEYGRAPTIGNPIQYQTTNQFLDKFNLKNIKDLPIINFSTEIELFNFER